ncbi:MAG: orotate phosphoribosyltransferase [Bacteroidales bacterium]|nr:orotate phosphoribosyltransferase [Bacteroidales bacterium]
MTNSKTIANYLLQIKAIKLDPANPFTWASGWKSPIYCDNRKILSFPQIRTQVRDAFAQAIKEKYPQAELIAGVATGAIAHGALVADILGLPFIYVRSSAKEHGLTNLIEGHYETGSKVVVIEDLISTGGSSLKAVNALRDAQCDVLGMVAIFTYEFENAIRNFQQANCQLTTLSNYSALIEQALTEKFIDEAQLQSLKQWRIAPDVWGI